MEMSKISQCSVTECAYNKHNACHTMAITVGGAADDCAECDTFFMASQRGGVMDLNGGVGACKQQDCTFNDSLECKAESITITKHETHAECATYRPQ